MTEIHDAMPESEPVELPEQQEESLNSNKGLSRFLTVNTVQGADEALTMAFEYGGIDGAHHKDWVIDKMVRALTGENYESFVAHACQGEDGPDTYEWNVGIAP